MIKVLVDGRISGHDGIGRYTRCLTSALRKQAGSRYRIEVLEPTGTPRYFRAEGTELLRAARSVGARIIHVADYRIPLEPAGSALVVAIHDILRLTYPDHCYTDQQFRSRSGDAALAELRLAVSHLRTRIPYPPGATRRPRTAHEEFYALMLAWAVDQAAQIIVPTQTVADQLSRAVGRRYGITVSHYGIDHDAVGEPTGGVQPRGLVPPPWPYLLYVGQARPHKGIGTMLEAYRRSRASAAGVRLVCVGRDFTVGAHDAGLAEAAGVVAVGAISDAALRRLYAGSLALVHLAESEGFGFTPLEALAAGTRVIASDIPVLRETLAHHALFTDLADAAQVSRAIDRVMAAADTPALAAGRRRWASQYRWSRHARDVIAAYDSAAAG